MDPADARTRVARTIAVDLVTAEVTGALRTAGVLPLLLKGPALSALLYGPGEHRSYADIDLLVPPDHEARAAEALRELGFEPLVDDDALRGHRPVHAHEWRRPGGASVDLHRTLPGARAEPAVVAEVLAAETTTIRVVGVDVETLAPPALLVQVALHAAHHGPEWEKALRDLELAAERVPDETWASAAAIAGRIDAGPAFAAGLRLAPAGAALADRLGLPHDAPVDVLLKASGAPPLAVGLDWLLGTQGARARLGLVARTAFPRPSALRLWRPLARRGRAGLVAAYASHPFWLARHAIPSVRAVRRARRPTRG
jgi:hypothetical protein